MSGKASRDRGARAERSVVNYLLGRGFDGARRHQGADGRAPGDIYGLPGVCIEVKDRASSAWPTWREQLVTETPPGDLSVLVRRVRGVPDVGAWDAEMPLRDWLWLDHRPGDPDAEFRARLRSLSAAMCRRTGTQWVRATFADVVDLLEKTK